MQGATIHQKNKKALAALTVLVVTVMLVMGAEALNKQPNNLGEAASTTKAASAVKNAATNQPYKDGTYTATGTYDTPDGPASIGVSVTVANGVLTNTSLSQHPTNNDSREYQAAFAGSYKTYVVGKAIDSIKLSRVSGSSLTPQGFNNALEQIKAQAQS